MALRTLTLSLQFAALVALVWVISAALWSL